MKVIAQNLLPSVVWCTQKGYHIVFEATTQLTGVGIMVVFLFFWNLNCTNDRNCLFIGSVSNKHGWLVVDLPLWKIWMSIGMIILSIWKNQKWSKPKIRINMVMRFQQKRPSDVDLFRPQKTGECTTSHTRYMALWFFWRKQLENFDCPIRRTSSKNLKNCHAFGCCGVP